jgi:hypothetical protein
LPGSNSRAVLGLAPSSLGQTISAGLKPLAERRNSLPEDGRQGVFDSVLTMAAEVQGAKTGIWNNPAVIKNTESPDDILARIGRLTVMEARFCSWGKPDSGLLEFRAELYMGTLL